VEIAHQHRKDEEKMDLKIIDSGWLSSTRTGTQEVAANRANSGTAMTLKSASIGLSGKALLDNSPIPASFADSPVNNNGYENDMLNISLIIDKSDNSEYDDLVEINKLKKTKGVKLLYPSVLTDTKKSLIELLGSTTTQFNDNEVGASTPVLMGFVRNVDINDSASSSKFRVKIIFNVTG
jgi:hypothetical protein